MNCADRELQIALYAGGDLPAGEITEVEQHLAACPDCRLSMAFYAANCAALAEAAVDAGEVAAAAVRRRVMSQLRGERRRMWPAWVAAAAALLVTIAAAARWTAARETATLTYTPAVPTVAAVVVPRPPVIAAHRSLRKVARLVKPKPQEGVLVKLETEDPNIVIYWVAD